MIVGQVSSDGGVVMWTKGGPSSLDAHTPMRADNAF